MTDIIQDKKALHGKIVTESGVFALAEFASMAVSLGVVGIADQVAPGLVKSASQAVSKTCVEPFLDTIEGALGKVCRLKECQPDLSKSREERAEALAKTMIVFSAAWAASMGAKLLTRGAVNRWTGVNPHELPKSGNWFKDQWNTINAELKNPETRKIFLADEGIHYGSILLMNTAGAHVTDEMINSTGNLLNKCGIPKHKAHEIASMAIVWELPNLLGMAAGIGSIAQNHLKGASHLEKLTAMRESVPAAAHAKI
jgi:hypothetical protein